MILRLFTPFIFTNFRGRKFSILSKVKLKDKFGNKDLNFFFLPVRPLFYEPTRRGFEYPPPPDKYSIGEYFQQGRKMLWGECKLWMQEISDKFSQDFKMYKHGDTEVIFRFDKEDCLENWSCSSDKVNNEGNSESQFVLINNGKALFSGNIDMVPKKDGKAKRAGFCAIRSKRLKKSFQRPHSYNWMVFTHLELRVRGDGRMYNVLLGMEHTFDLLWLDLYMYPIFTRGGPYWETIRVPFSKFYLTSKGRVQDKQDPVHKLKINSVGLQCAGTPGPFSLEIDYIGVHADFNETEKFAYELYNIPKYIVSI